ncbi:MAG: 30S ribosomal protein S16 [Candidatus Kerfeldbacteria bacterium]|nr:30S ribosomal protein S16 [Candidatus Kerfeldbacteria bacterium]
MLVIRLSRIGRRNLAQWRIVLQEKTQSPKAKAIELLGHMNPHTDPRTVVLKEDRVKYWLSQGAQPSPTIHNLLVDLGILKTEKVKAYKVKKKAKTEGEEVKPEAKAPEAKTE